MKTRTLVSSLILVLALLIIAGSCATKKRMVKDSEELYGTWINEEYKATVAPFEITVFNPNGTMSMYRTEKAHWETDVEVLEGGWIPCDTHTYTIEDKWTDSDGNVWYKVEAIAGGYEKVSPITAYLLIKISDSNRVLEFMVGRIVYREEIDPTEVDYTYRIYYRQE